jgi:N-terminal domain of NWD NACHT-NTPase
VIFAHKIVSVVANLRSLRRDDIWALAIDKLGDDVKQHIDFGSTNILDILADLLKLTEISHQECIRKRWRYVRRNGEVVIIRDLFAKMIKWLDVFKQIGDNAMQFDPYHAALPWAGIRFVLQVAVNDLEKFGFIVDGVATLTYLIDYYYIFESLYLEKPGLASKDLQQALVHVYAMILEYLCNAKAFFAQKTPKRVLGSALLRQGHFVELLARIEKHGSIVNKYAALVDAEVGRNLENRVATLANLVGDHHSKMKALLSELEAPIRRVDTRLQDIHDNLSTEGRLKILLWLSSQPYLQHHEESKKDVLAGTGRWLLAEPVFAKWRNGSGSSILWLHGVPGSGKTKLTYVESENYAESNPTESNILDVDLLSLRNYADVSRLANVLDPHTSIAQETPLNRSAHGLPQY